MANTFRALLPDGRLPSEAVAHVQELVGDASAGGFYIDEDGVQVPYVMVASVEEPEPTIVIDGRTFEVWWVQLDPPDPAAWVPKPVVQAEGSRAFVVPADAGAVYTVDGQVRAAGTYAVQGMDATSIAWSATPRSGYTFAPGAVTSGTLEFPARTYQPGDVVFSDSFAREGALSGSQTDSFEGGDPLTWANTRASGATNRTAGGALQVVRATTELGAGAWDQVVFPVSFTNVDVFMVAKVINAAAPAASGDGITIKAGATGVMKIKTDGGTILYSPSAQSFPAAPGTVEGDMLRIEYRSGQVPTTHNLTRGTVSDFTGTYEPTPLNIDALAVTLGPTNGTEIGSAGRHGFDSIKVVAQ